MNGRAVEVMVDSEGVNSEILTYDMNYLSTSGIINRKVYHVLLGLGMECSLFWLTNYYYTLTDPQVSQFLLNSVSDYAA